MTGPVEVYAARGKCRAEFLRWRQRPVLDYGTGGDVERARHMAGAHPGARLGCGTEKAISRPRIDNLRGAASQRRAHGFEGSNDVSGSARGEPAWCPLDRAGFNRSPFCLPFRKSSIEDEDVLDAEQAKRPPYPRRRKHACAVIHDDGVAIGDSERPDLARELLGVRQHMGQGVGMIGNRVDVEAYRAGNVSGEIFGRRVAFHRGQIERAVHHHGRRGAEARGQPVGGHQPAGRRAFIRHDDSHLMLERQRLNSTVSSAFQGSGRSECI